MNYEVIEIRFLLYKQEKRGNDSIKVNETCSVVTLVDFIN